MKQRTNRYVVMLVAAGLIGCRNEENQLRIGGVVVYRGQKVHGGTVLFQPLNGKPLVAEIDQEGRYELTAPPGTYSLGIVASSEIPEGVDPWKPGAKLPKSIVPERLGRPGTSGISVTVAPENTSIDITLR